MHGPLQTILVLDLCRRNDSRPVKRLDYRSLSPVFHGERLTVNGEPDASGAKAQLCTEVVVTRLPADGLELGQRVMLDLVEVDPARRLARFALPAA